LNLIQNTARSDRYRVVRRVADARNQQKQPGADVARFQAEIDRLEAEVKDWDVKVKAAEQAFQTLMDAAPELPGWAMGVRDRDMAEDCRVHIRGETTNLGDVVPRGVLHVLPNVVGELPPDRSGRRQLADWLVARDNPLTARVYVNRLWQHLFGRGIVASPDDFGVNGAPPTHPELLDSLSVEFAEHGASTKRSVRQIALSRAYQLSSEPSEAHLQVDPDNTLLWRMSPRRVEVEPFRDAVLAVAGRLDLSTPKPEQLFLARLHPYRQPEFFNFDPPFKPHDIDQPFRSVYLPVVRGVLPTMFQLFDFAAPDRPVAQRDDSTVPAQSLFLLNNAWIIEQSRHAARRLLDDSSLDEDQRVQRLYRLAYGRAPTADELRDARDFLTMPDVVANDATSTAPPRTSPAANTAPKSASSQTSPHETRWISLVQAILGSAEFRVLR
ncbi:MAG TPA: DUF1553 domain-containing protein, partial [Pirellulaceae bacterium]|nr:DUF1553 domain-containing protein [Pirellulaceae bacterium]